MPTGWEQRKTASGRVYYVDHNNRTTQFTDPRLNGHIINQMRQHGNNTAAPSSSAPTGSSASATASHNGAARIAAGGETFSVPQPQQQQQQPVTAQTAQQQQQQHQHQLQNASLLPASADLPRGLLDGSDLLPKYRRDLVSKMRALRIELLSLQPQSGHCRLEVSRVEILEESYRLVMKMRPKDMRKRLMVKFKGEEGLDYGGIAREWLHLLSREMLNPQYGLFQYSRDDHYTLQINSDSGMFVRLCWHFGILVFNMFFVYPNIGVNPDHLSYFHFVGRVLGIAVFHGHCLDGGFTTPFYKQLLNKPITLDDIEGVDPELHHSLTWLL